MIKKKTTTGNPIKELLHELQTNTIIITLPYLDMISKLFEKYGVKFSSYVAVFEMLEFLEQNGCVTITPQGDGSYTITGLYTYGR